MGFVRDLALIDRLAGLYTSVVSDELDKAGYRDQVMRPDIRPLSPDARIAGYAFPVHAVPVFEVPEHPYQHEFAAVDALQHGDVMCVSKTEGSFWGELLSTAASYRGCRGVIVDGYTRDTKAIMAMDFPVFVRGIHMADSLGRLDVVGYNVPIVCGGVRMAPGDLVLADYDGVVVIPHAIGAEIIALAEEKVRGENLVRDHLRLGMSVTEAWQRFGVM